LSNKSQTCFCLFADRRLKISCNLSDRPPSEL
jgi:hypothetical protein